MLAMSMNDHANGSFISPRHFIIKLMA